ncbi:MAG: PaaI family thioesterase [Proteobacteria bacterium]|nr:PaaI family thioesterase [Pseudomonadota bacterium]
MCKDEEYQQLPNIFGNRCFGCSPDNPAGLQMTFKANKESVVSILTVPEHLCGWSKVIHGGVVTTILDEVMSWTAIHLLKSLVMTKTITIDFLKPAYIDGKIKAEGRVLEVKSRHEAVMEGFIYDAKGKVCAKSIASFATFSPKVAKRLGIIKNDKHDWFKEFSN